MARRSPWGGVGVDPAKEADYRERARIRTAERRREDPDGTRARTKASALRIRTRNRIDVRALKLLRGCIDCGYDSNADALEFDHRPGEGKRPRGVGGVIGNTRLLIAEIAKCDVRCANCHAIRTQERRRESEQAA